MPATAAGVLCAAQIWNPWPRHDGVCLIMHQGFLRYQLIIGIRRLRLLLLRRLITNYYYYYCYCYCYCSWPPAPTPTLTATATATVAATATTTATTKGTVPDA